jgi:hypothetical protein
MNTTEKDKPVERAEIAYMTDVEMIVWEAEAFMALMAGELIRHYEADLKDGNGAAGIDQLCRLHRRRLSEAFNVGHRLYCDAMRGAKTGGAEV